MSSVGCRPVPRAAGLGTKFTHDAPYRSAQDLHQPLPAGPRQRLRKTPLHRLKPAETFVKDRTSALKENSLQKPTANTEREHTTEAPRPPPDAHGTRARLPPSAPGPRACLSRDALPVSVCRPSARSAQRSTSQRTGSASRLRQTVRQDAERGPLAARVAASEQQPAHPQHRVPVGGPRPGERTQQRVCPGAGARGAGATPLPGGPSHVTCSPACRAVSPDCGAAPAERRPPTAPARRLLPAPTRPRPGPARAPAQPRALTAALLARPVSRGGLPTPPWAACPASTNVAPPPNTDPASSRVEPPALPARARTRRHKSHRCGRCRGFCWRGAESQRARRQPRH